MKTLYINNYKGFTNTFIPFLDVNFFVGENSTGKTSILNLLNVISEPSFWFQPNFNNDMVELGYFSEIVNQNSKDKTCFEIGIEYNEKKIKNTKGIKKFIWMKFKNKNDIPLLSEYMTIIADKNVLVSISKQTVFLQNIEYKGEVFSDWIKIVSHFDGPRKKVPILKGLDRIPLALIRSIIESEVDPNLNEEKSVPIKSSIDIIFKRFIWMAPIRAKAKRTYDAFKLSFSPEGEHAPIILRNLISAQNSDRKEKIINSLIKFGKESALFDNIKIDEYSKGKLHGGPFAIDVIYNNLAVKITNVGYGVSQVIPLLIEILTSSKGSTFVIQQPEVHLHPKAQAVFGEFIFDSTVESKHHFMIETHSDFMINRFRYNLNKPSLSSKPTGQVLFFEKNELGTFVNSIEFSENGQFKIELPESYGKFFIDEEFKMLEF